MQVGAEGDGKWLPHAPGNFDCLWPHGLSCLAVDPQVGNMALQLVDLDQEMLPLSKNPVIQTHCTKPRLHA